MLRRHIPFLFAGAASAQLTFEEYNPPSTLKVPGSNIVRSKFPHIDIHNHQNGMMTVDEQTKLVAEMDKLNMRMMVNLNGNYGSRGSDVVKNMKSKYPNRFIVFANLDFNNIDDPGYGERTAAVLEANFKAGAQGLKFFKSFGM